MRSTKSVVLFLLLAAVVVITGGWGFLVHKTTHQLAVYELPKGMQRFFYKNIENIVQNAPRPDVRRNEDKNEGPRHFIDLEAFGDSAAWKMPLKWDDAVAKYSKDTLYKYGIVPYYVIRMKDKLTDAFKAGNADSILFYAADLGHYIEDANVPLHTSLNHDGQLTNQRGLHALWESVVPEVEISSYNLHAKHKATYLKQPELAIWTAVRRAHGLLPELFAKEKEVSKGFTDSTKYKMVFKYGKNLRYYTDAFAAAYGKSLKPTVNDQLINSANLVADFWYTAWVDAGKPDLDKLIAGGWNKADKKAYKKEYKSYKRNQLVQDSLLRSLKGSFRD